MKRFRIEDDDILYIENKDMNPSVRKRSRKDDYDPDESVPKWEPIVPGISRFLVETRARIRHDYFEYKETMLPFQGIVVNASLYPELPAWNGSNNESDEVDEAGQSDDYDFEGFNIRDGNGNITGYANYKTLYPSIISSLRPERIIESEQGRITYLGSDNQPTTIRWETEENINPEKLVLLGGEITGNDKLYARELYSDSSDSIDEITPNPVYNPSLDLSDHIVEPILCPHCDGSLISTGMTGEICSNGCGYNLEDLYPEIDNYLLEVFGPMNI